MAQSAPPLNSMCALLWIRQLLGLIFGCLMADIYSRLSSAVWYCLPQWKSWRCPESIREKASRLKYISQWLRPSGKEEVSAIERYTQNVGVMAQLNPDVLDTVDFDVASEIVEGMLWAYRPRCCAIKTLWRLCVKAGQMLKSKPRLKR